MKRDLWGRPIGDGLDGYLTDRVFCFLVLVAVVALVLLNHGEAAFWLVLGSMVALGVSNAIKNLTEL